jgi:hypothetical protein
MSVMVQIVEFGASCIGPDSDTEGCNIARLAPESLAPKLWMGREPRVYSNLRVFEPRGQTINPKPIRDTRMVKMSSRLFSKVIRAINWVLKRAKC